MNLPPIGFQGSLLPTLKPSEAHNMYDSPFSDQHTDRRSSERPPDFQIAWTSEHQHIHASASSRGLRWLFWLALAASVLFANGWLRQAPALESHPTSPPPEIFAMPPAWNALKPQLELAPVQPLHPSSTPSACTARQLQFPPRPAMQSRTTAARQPAKHAPQRCHCSQ
jgi:hypothetical protein